jgi:hypothetical protein
MKTKNQKTETTTAPALTDAEKRTRDAVAAADIATTEAHNQRGTPAAERVHVPTAEDPGEAPERTPTNPSARALMFTIQATARTAAARVVAGADRAETYAAALSHIDRITEDFFRTAAKARA